MSLQWFQWRSCPSITWIRLQFGNRCLHYLLSCHLPKTPFLRNYMGGAFCYVSREYSGRVKTIVRSWRIANNIKEEEAVDAEETCHKVKRVDVSRVVQRSWWFNKNAFGDMGILNVWLFNIIHAFEVCVGICEVCENNNWSGSTTWFGGFHVWVLLRHDKISSRFCFLACIIWAYRIASGVLST